MLLLRKSRANGHHLHHAPNPSPHGHLHWGRQWVSHILHMLCLTSRIPIWRFLLTVQQKLEQILNKTTKTQTLHISVTQDIKQKPKMGWKKLVWSMRMTPSFLSSFTHLFNVNRRKTYARKYLENVKRLHVSSLNAPNKKTRGNGLGVKQNNFADVSENAGWLHYWNALPGKRLGRQQRAMPALSSLVKHLSAWKQWSGPLETSSICGS